MSDLPPSVLRALLEIKLGEQAFAEILDRVVRIVRDALDGADEVSITLIQGETPFTAAYSGQLALDADEMQYARGYGPCLDAGLSGTVMEIPDMRKEDRWPDYAAAVVPRGVLGSLSIPLPMQTEVIGALNCYTRTPEGLVDDVRLAVDLAAHVALAIRNAYTHDRTARFADDMVTAMASRAVIEQAKGVIMAQNRCDPDAAFTVLRRASMGRNVKLRDLAAEIVSRVSGTPPDALA